MQERWFRFNVTALVWIYFLESQYCTYSYISFRIGENERWLTDAQKLALRLLWGYFFDVRKMRFDTFISILYPENKESERTPLPGGLSDAAEICKAHASATTGWPADEIRILMPVNKIAWTPIPHELLKELGRVLDNAALKLYPIVTGTDALLIVEGAAASGRGVRWIHLETLDNAQVKSLFEDFFGRLSLKEKRILELCFVEANGYAQILEQIYHVYSYEQKFIDRTREIKEKFVYIMQKATINARFSRPNIKEIALGLLGVPVDANLKVPHDSKKKLSVNQLVKSAFFITSVHSDPKKMLLGLSGSMIRNFLKSERCGVCTNFNIASIKEHSLFLTHFLNEILNKECLFSLRVSKNNDYLNPSCGHPFEYFHCCAELIQLHARAVCNSFLPTWKIVNKRFVEASMQQRYGLDDTSLANRPESDRQLLQTALLWPLALLKVRPKVVGFAELLGDVWRARVDAKFVPPLYMFNDKMEGFDAAIVVREAASPENVWCVVFDMKHSLPENARKHVFSAKNLNRKVTALRNKEYDETLRKVGASRLVYVIVAWHHSSCGSVSNWELSERFPDAIVTLDRSLLGRFYTSLKPYASYFAGERLFEVRQHFAVFNIID